jgi:hypothetical protein
MLALLQNGKQPHWWRTIESPHDGARFGSRLTPVREAHETKPTHQSMKNNLGAGIEAPN